MVNEVPSRYDPYLGVLENTVVSAVSDHLTKSGDATWRQLNDTMLKLVNDADFRKKFVSESEAMSVFKDENSVAGKSLASVLNGVYVISASGSIPEIGTQPFKGASTADELRTECQGLMEKLAVLRRKQQRA